MCTSKVTANARSICCDWSLVTWQLQVATATGRNAIYPGELKPIEFSASAWRLGG